MKPSEIQHAVFIAPSWQLALVDHAHLMERAHRAGCAVTVYVMDREMPRDASIVPENVTLRSLPLSRGSWRKRDAALTTIEALRIARRHPKAVITTLGVPASIIVALPLWILGGRLVVILCGMGIAFGDSSPKMRAIQKALLSMWRPMFQSDRTRIVTHNVEDKKYLDENLGLREGQVVAVGGAGVDPQRFPFVAQLPDNPAPAILVPARLLREKGFFEAVEASRILDNRGVSHELRFTGRLDLGNPHGITQAELDQAENTAPSVNVLPFQDDIHAAYAAADIICLPTYYREGLPTTLSEASAVGRAIASTNSIGVRDIITDDVNGLLAEPRAAEPLADVLQRLIEDPALRERLRQEAYTKYLARFTKDHNVTDHAPAYRALGLELDRMQA